MSAALKPVRPLVDFLRVLIAPTIWFAHLAVVYAAESLICIGPPADRGTTMGWVVFLATVAALTGFIMLVAGLRRSGSAPPRSDHANSWFRRVSLLMIFLSALGVIWTTLPSAVLPACAL